MGVWARSTWGREFAVWLFDKHQALIMGGFFAAEAANLRRYPCSLYAAMRNQQKHPNEEVDLFIERAWGMLLTAPSVPCALLNATRHSTRRHACGI